MLTIEWWIAVIKKVYQQETYRKIHYHPTEAVYYLPPTHQKSGVLGTIQLCTIVRYAKPVAKDAFPVKVYILFVS